MKLSQIPALDLASYDVVSLGAMIYIVDDESDRPVLCQHAIVCEKSNMVVKNGQTIIDQASAIKCILVVPTAHDKKSGVIPIFKLTNNIGGDGIDTTKVIH